MTQCRYEREVVDATKFDRWTDILKNHAASCSLCQETMKMTMMMGKISSQSTAHSLPSYRLIWLKAQYARKRERLSAFDLVALIGMSLVGVAGLSGLLLWRFPQLFTGIIDVTGSSASDLKNVFSHGAPLAVIAGVVVMVWLLTRDSFFAER